MIKQILLLLVILSLFSTSTLAQNISEAGASFLILPPGSRANAMGGAYTALADDHLALYYNPAGISRLQKGAVGFFHHNQSTPIVDFPRTFIGAVYATKIGIFGAAFNNHDEDLDDPLNGGKLESYERALQITYAKQLNPHLALGGSLKLVRGKFGVPSPHADVSANAIAIDVGVLVQNLWPHLTYFRQTPNTPSPFQKFHRSRFRGLAFGISLLNTGPDRLVYIDESQSDPLPQILRLGAAFNLIDTDEVGILLAMDLAKFLVERDKDGLPKGFVESWFTAWDDGFDWFHFGAEIEIFHIFAFRIGRDEDLNWGRDHGIGEWTYGFGIGPEWARLNLARRSIPIGFEEKWILDFVLSY